MRLGGGDKLAKCKRVGCAYLRHSDPLVSREFHGYCCGGCKGIDEEGIWKILPNGRYHGDKCEGVLVREYRPGQCQSPGCTYLKHKDPEKIQEFGDYCCRVCRDNDGQRHGPYCNEEPAPLPTLLSRPGSVKAPTPAFRDLARGRPVKASSQDEHHLAANTVDGSQGTHWSPSSSASCHWLYVDLGQVYSLSRVSVRWEASCAKSYFVEGSDDVVTWRNLTSEIGDEGWVVTPLLGKSWRWLRIFTSDPRPSIREFRVYPLVTGMDFLSKVVVQARGGILDFLDTLTGLPVLASANSYMLGLVRSNAIPQPRMEGASAKAPPLPEYQVAMEDLGVEPEYLHQSKLCSTLQEMEKEFRMNSKRRAELADPAHWERVLEQAVRKAFWLYEQSSEWKDFRVKVRRRGLPTEDLMECNVYSTVRSFLFEGAWTLPVEFLTFALESICQREFEHSVRVVLEDLCQCAQLAAPPLEKQLSLCTLLLERAVAGALPPPTTRFQRDVMETYDGALSKFLECMDHYMDEHKEKAFVSAFVAPTRYYLRLVCTDPSTAHDILRHGQNLWLFFALLDSTLGVRMPRFAAFRHDTTGPLTGVVDFWFGLTEEAKQLFRQEEHFGKEELPEHLQASRHISAWTMRSLFPAHKDPAEQASHPHLRPRFAMRRRCFYHDLPKGLVGSDPKYQSQRKQLTSYLERFAYFFRPDFFARQALTTLGREARPEHRGFRNALETLYAKYRREEIGPRSEASVWEHLYPQDPKEKLDVARAKRLLAWCGSSPDPGDTQRNVLRRAFPGAEANRIALEQKMAAVLIQSRWRGLRRRSALALSDEGDSGTLSSLGPHSAPADVDSSRCLLPGTRVLFGSAARELTDLRQGDVLDEAVVKRVDLKPGSVCTIVDIRYEGKGGAQQGLEYSLQVTRAHHLCVRRLGKDSFKAWPAFDLKPGDFLRNDRGDTFRVTRAVPRSCSTACLEVCFRDQRSTMCVGAAGTPKEAFVEVYGERDVDDRTVKMLTFSRHDDFKAVFLDNPGELLRLCSQRLQEAGFSSDLGEGEWGFPRSPKMFVDPAQAPMVIESLHALVHEGKMPMSGLNKRVVIVNSRFYRVVKGRVNEHNLQIRRQKKEAKDNLQPARNKGKKPRGNNRVKNEEEIFLDEIIDRFEPLPYDQLPYDELAKMQRDHAITLNTPWNSRSRSRVDVHKTFVEVVELPYMQEGNSISSGYDRYALSDSHAKGAAHVGNLNWFEKQPEMAPHACTRHRSRNVELPELERTSADASPRPAPERV